MQTVANQAWAVVRTPVLQEDHGMLLSSSVPVSREKNALLDNIRSEVPTENS